MTRLLLPIAALVLIVGGCSSDDGSDATDDAAPQAADTAASRGAETGTGTGPEVDDAEEAAEALQDFDEALDDAGEDGLADALGTALVNVLSGATDYEVVDGTLVVDMDGSSEGGEDTCVIATTARTGIGSSTPISLVYDDGTVDCD